MYISFILLGTLAFLSLSTASKVDIPTLVEDVIEAQADIDVLQQYMSSMSAMVGDGKICTTCPITDQLSGEIIPHLTTLNTTVTQLGKVQASIAASGNLEYHVSSRFPSEEYLDMLQKVFTAYNLAEMRQGGCSQHEDFTLLYCNGITAINPTPTLGDGDSRDGSAADGEETTNVLVFIETHGVEIANILLVGALAVWTKLSNNVAFKRIGKNDVRINDVETSISSSVYEKEVTKNQNDTRDVTNITISNIGGNTVSSRRHGYSNTLGVLDTNKISEAVTAVAVPDIVGMDCVRPHYNPACHARMEESDDATDIAVDIVWCLSDSSYRKPLHGTPLPAMIRKSTPLASVLIHNLCFIARMTGKNPLEATFAFVKRLADSNPNVGTVVGSCDNAQRKNKLGMTYPQVLTTLRTLVENALGLMTKNASFIIDPDSGPETSGYFAEKLGPDLACAEHAVPVAFVVRDAEKVYGFVPISSTTTLPSASNPVAPCDPARYASPMYLLAHLQQEEMTGDDIPVYKAIGDSLLALMASDGTNTAPVSQKICKHGGLASLCRTRTCRTSEPEPTCPPIPYSSKMSSPLLIPETANALSHGGHFTYIELVKMLEMEPTYVSMVVKTLDPFVLCAISEAYKYTIASGYKPGQYLLKRSTTLEQQVMKILAHKPILTYVREFNVKIPLIVTDEQTNLATYVRSLVRIAKREKTKIPIHKGIPAKLQKHLMKKTGAFSPSVIIDGSTAHALIKSDMAPQGYDGLAQHDDESVEIEMSPMHTVSNN